MSKPPSRRDAPAARDPEEQDGASHTEINQYWQGPLPPPAVLEQFRHLVPDAPERIFAAWEAESRHRREWENRALNGQITTTRIGQAGAIVFSLSAMGVTGLALWLNQPWVAGVVGGATVVSVVGAFLYRHAKDERE